MGKFKVGDRVRRIDESSAPTEFGVVGREYTVKGAKVDCINVIGDWWATAVHFELVQTEGPVRAVTRKEIVPGTCGAVVVEHAQSDGHLRVYTSLFTKPSASELRAAAATLVEIAAALEPA